MTPRDRLGLAAVLAAVILAAMPTPAQACACSPIVSVPGQQARPVAFDREVAIFSGTVVEQSILKQTVTLEVLQVWKGELPYLTTIPILNWNNCEFWFEVGKTYLIFGLGDSIATMRAEKCTLTAPLEDAGGALEMLKAAGYRPRQPQMR